ncbi:MAG: hypothetical protein JWO67_4513 [Streptosporangiaceae bacterium]|nr:hypothetical protein [Streptosporangiaceae bacterium]
MRSANITMGRIGPVWTTFGGVHTGPMRVSAVAGATGRTTAATTPGVTLTTATTAPSTASTTVPAMVTASTTAPVTTGMATTAVATTTAGTPATETTTAVTSTTVGMTDRTTVRMTVGTADLTTADLTTVAGTTAATAAVTTMATDIEPGSAVMFEDSYGFPHWGVALSGVITSEGRWPEVLVRVGRTRDPVKIPARDVELWGRQPVQAVIAA